jgi:hypothetical protein
LFVLPSRLAPFARAFVALALLAGALGAGSAVAAPPANDNFANAQVVGPTLPVSIATTNVASTGEPGEKPHYSTNPPQSSVWFRWTAPSAAKVTVSSCEPDLNFGQVAVYTGNAVGALTTVVQAGECIGRFTPVAGTTYSIAVEGNGTRKPFTFSLRQFSPPSNDSMASPLTVGPALPVSKAASNVDSGVEAGEPSGHGSDGRSVWFKWVAPESAKVRVDVCDFDPVSGAGNAGVFVYKAPLTLVVSDSDDCRVSFDAVNGSDYRIAFSATSRGEGDFTLKLAKEAPPANDMFAAAEPIGPWIPVRISGTTLFSTVEANEPHHGSDDAISFPPSDTVWYRWTPSATTAVRMSACDADFSSRLGVYTGAALNGLTPVTPNPALTGFPFCTLRFQAQAGTTYRIAVGGPGSEDEGDFALDIHAFNPPANDNLAAAQSLASSLPVSVSGSNVDASAEENEPSHTIYDDDEAIASVWYSWTPTANLPVAISTCGSTFPSSLAVYRGAALLGLNEVAAGSGGCPAGDDGNELEFSALAGTEYWIAVDSRVEDLEGTFALSLADLTTIPPVTPAAQPPVPAPLKVVPGPRKPAFSLKRALKKCAKIKRKAPHRKCVKKAKKRAKAARKGR